MATTDLTPAAERRQRLLAAGIPQAFLAALSSLDERSDDLDIVLRDEEDAYFYLPTSSWADLEGYEVTPIASGSNGDTFFLLLTRGEEQRLVDFGLEEGIRLELDSFDQALARIVMEFADLRDDLDDAAIERVALELGYAKTRKLLAAWQAKDAEALKRLAGT